MGVLFRVPRIHLCQVWTMESTPCPMTRICQERQEMDSFFRDGFLLYSFVTLIQVE